MNWISNKNILNINNKERKFKYDIGIVKECDNNIIVMLEYKKELPKEEFTNNVYAISEDGNILWKMENPKDKNIKIDPLINFIVKDNSIMVVDYCSNKLYINKKNGLIISRESGIW